MVEIANIYSMIILKKALIAYKHSTVNGYLRQCRIAEEVALISMVPYASEIIKHFERTGTMKRILAFLLVSVLIFGICGCAKSGKEEAAANDLFTDEFSVMWSVYAASPALQKAASRWHLSYVISKV